MAAMTHRVSFKLGDGGKFAVFDVTFNPQGEQTITKVVSFSEPIPSEFIQDCLDYLDIMTKLYVKYGGLKSVAAMEIGYRDPHIRYEILFDDLAVTEQTKYELKKK